MKIQGYVLTATALLGMLMSAACTLYVQTPTPTAASMPAVAGPTSALVATLDPATELAVATQATTSQAPICAATVSCAALNAEQIRLDCVKKVPYTNVLVPKGTTFEVVDPSGQFTCIDSGAVANDKAVLTCHGKELYSFQLKLSNSACSGSIVSSPQQCQEGYGYDSASQCCAPVSSDGAGSTTVTIDLGGCP